MEKQHNGVEHQTKTFLKGTLPSWFTSICLGVLVLMGQRAIAEFDSLRVHLQETRERLVATEAQIKSIESGLLDIKSSQKDIMREIRAVNLTIKNP